MSTMLSGAAVMDAALLLIAGNETCPQPQTSEHLAAIEIMKLSHIVILQNKGIYPISISIYASIHFLTHSSSRSYARRRCARALPVDPQVHSWYRRRWLPHYSHLRSVEVQHRCRQRGPCQHHPH